MLKKLSALAISLSVCGVLALTGPAFAAKGFKHLSFEGSYMDKHPTVVKVWKPFFAEAEKKFGGKLSFDYFAVNALYPEKEGLSAMTDGRVDFGTVRPSVFPGKMNLLSAPALPGMCPNSIIGSLVTEELIQKSAAVRAELPQNTVHYVAWCSAPYQFHTVKPVKSLADLKGKKIIVWDATTLEYAKALGANPIRMTSTDTYLSLSKNMADGVLCPIAPLRSFKISEAAKYHFITNLGVNTFVMQVNKELWDSIPKDMKEWLTAEGGLKMALAAGQSLDGGAASDTELLKKQGHEFYPISDADKAAMLKAFEPFANKWKTEECKGMNQKDIDDVYKFVQERVKYHTEQFKAGKYGNYSL